MNLATILHDPSALKATSTKIPSFDEWIIIDGSHQRLPGRPPEFVMQLVRPQGSPNDPILEITCFLDPLWGYMVELIEFTLLKPENAGEKPITKVEVISRVRWKHVTSLAPGVMELRSPLIEIPRLEFIQVEDDYRLQDFVRTRHFEKTVVEDKLKRKVVETVSLVHPMSLHAMDLRKKCYLHVRSTDTWWHDVFARQRTLHGYVHWERDKAADCKEVATSTDPDIIMVYEERERINGTIKIKKGALKDDSNYLIIFVLFLDLLDWRKKDFTIRV